MGCSISGALKGNLPIVKGVKFAKGSVPARYPRFFWIDLSALWQGVWGPLSHFALTQGLSEAMLRGSHRPDVMRAGQVSDF